ncbi:MAG: GNAT family N-acetyltransferase [Azospirillaceae bacterium]
MDGLSPASSDRARLLAYEETVLTTWPALEQVFYDGWILRFAGGFTGRANSVNPLYAGSGDGPALPDKIARCERLYAERGLDCVFRLTPLADPELDAELAARGYERERTSIALILDLDRVVAETPAGGDTGGSGLVLMARPEAAWVDAYQAAGARPAEARPLFEAILARIPGRAIYAMVADAGGAGAAVAQGVIDGERVHLVNIATAPGARRRGLARRLVAELAVQARRAGAVEGLIHVAADNAAAVALYDGFGAREAYRYHYRRQSDASGDRYAMRPAP